MDPASTIPSLSCDSCTSKTMLGYVNLGLPSHLNINDDSLNWADMSMDQQSVHEEYHTYSFGAHMKMDVNLLKF